jgi:dTDP-4-dehydrorhamnose 3,5-epimerase
MMDLKVIEGGIGVDDRGTVTFANAFNFPDVKRFYMVSNFNTATIRAFHGHEKEGKYVFVTKGSIILCAVKMDDKVKPNKTNPMNRYVLSSRKPAIVFIPPGYANGFRSLEEDSQIIFFSTSTLEESKGDDYRFPADYWGNQIWQIENR